MTLVGKADVCPYNLANAGDIDERNVYERCEGLRERNVCHVAVGLDVIDEAERDDVRSRRLPTHTVRSTLRLTCTSARWGNTARTARH
jgi:hypothetical protein